MPAAAPAGISSVLSLYAPSLGPLLAPAMSCLSLASALLDDLCILLFAIGTGVLFCHIVVYAQDAAPLGPLPDLAVRGIDLPIGAAMQCVPLQAPHLDGAVARSCHSVAVHEAEAFRGRRVSIHLKRRMLFARAVVYLLSARLFAHERTSTARAPVAARIRRESNCSAVTG